MLPIGHTPDFRVFLLVPHRTSSTSQVPLQARTGSAGPGVRIPLSQPAEDPSARIRDSSLHTAIHSQPTTPATWREMSRHALWERPFARELPDTAVDAVAASPRLLPGVCIAALDDGPSSRLHQIARYTANPRAAIQWLDR